MPSRLSAVVLDKNGRRRARFVSILRSGGIEITGVFDGVGELTRLDSPFDTAVLASDGDLQDQVIEPTRVLSEAYPDARVVAICQELTNRLVRDGFEAGLHAMVLEEDVAEALVPSIRAAHAGQISLPERWRRQFGRPVLSARQKQVLSMVVMGLTNAKIARTLGVAENTVKSHLSSAFKKLGVRSRKEATALILDPKSGLGTGILTIREDEGLP